MAGLQHDISREHFIWICLTSVGDSPYNMRLNNEGFGSIQGMSPNTLFPRKRLFPLGQSPESGQKCHTRVRSKFVNSAVWCVLCTPACDDIGPYSDDMLAVCSLRCVCINSPSDRENGGHHALVLLRRPKPVRGTRSCCLREGIRSKPDVGTWLGGRVWTVRIPLPHLPQPKQAFPFVVL